MTKAAPALQYDLTMQQLFFIYRSEQNSEGWLTMSVPPAGLSIQEEGFSCHRTETEIIFLAPLLFVVFWTEVAITGKQ